MRSKKIKFQKSSVELLNKIKIILEDFKKENINVTLRQLYYQLVTRNLILNNKKQYHKLANLLTNARYTGIISWESIEDRTRRPSIPQTFSDTKHLIRVAKYSYALDRWKDQEYYVELWTEKDAISSVISPIADKYQVPLVINRGYSSASSMYESSLRFLSNEHKKLIILYLGDHDPSGLDMDRDIKQRLKEFCVDVEVIRIGLTFDQVQKYNPPVNPTKIKDKRTGDYIKKYGANCWEVDALRPEVLQELVEQAILRFLDVGLYEQVKQKEQDDLYLLEANL